MDARPMNHWRITLELKGPYATPFVSGTLFGQMCWAKLRREGTRALETWLAPIREKAEVLLLSDVLPRGLLPRPLLPPPPFDPARAAQHKKLKKKPFVRREAFLAARHDLGPDSFSEKDLADAPEEKPTRRPHNVIDRLRGTVRDEAGLFFVDEWWPKLVDEQGRPTPDRLRDLYLATTLPIEPIIELLRAVGAWGFGRDSSWGRGRFLVERYEGEHELFAHSGNRWLSLSHGCWTDELEEPRYRLATHFGKLAIEAGMACGRPWKRPILLMKPGSTFAARGPGPFGKWLEGIVHSEVPGILGYTPGHHAFHLVVPYTERSHGR
ncbi:MAG: hypothetical protein RMK73_15005 [Geminicoccaceae bacterium]|nr:hypothetical protein [Geminicoccaceae bacterium]MDW8342791.1 hypothetical protein [Geminicoccaceae bacterium]